MVIFNILTNCLSFLKVVPNLWNVDGEVAVPEQKPGEVAEELASSYERKLIEVRLPGEGPRVCSDLGCSGNFPGKAQSAKTGTLTGQPISATPPNKTTQKTSVWIKEGGVDSLKIIT